MFKLVWKDYFTVRFVFIILLPQNPSSVLEWIVIVVLSAVLMLKLSGVILFFLLLHIESCDSCGRFSHGWVAHLMNIVRQTFLLNTLYSPLPLFKITYSYN